MAIASKDELIDIVKKLMGSSYNVVSTDGFEQAVQQALDELKWTLPCTDSQKGYWITERARRHVIYVLLVESAHKFRFKEIHLHNRFAHYFQLIKMMDDQFTKAIDSNLILFDCDTYEHFGSYLTNGFVYDFYGQDHTYDGWK